MRCRSLHLIVWRQAYSIRTLASAYRTGLPSDCSPDVVVLESAYGRGCHPTVVQMLLYLSQRTDGQTAISGRRGAGEEWQSGGREGRG